MHFASTSTSRLNMVERFFRDPGINRLYRGVFANVPDLVTAIGGYVAVHHQNQNQLI